MLAAGGHDLRGSPSRPSRKAATAASLAPLRTAPAVPPRPGHFQAQLQGAEPLEIGRLELASRIARRQSSFAATPAARARPRQGVLDRQLHVRRTQLGDHRTIHEFYHGMHDRLRMNHHARSARLARSNSQRASMISRALFIKVAESMVTFGPMSQVGWARASATDTWASCSDRAGAKRPAAGREHHPPDLLAPARLHGLEDGAVFAIDGQNPGLLLRGQPHDQRPGHHQAFLVGQGHGLAGLQGGPSALQAGASDDRRKHRVDLRVGHHAGDALRADQQLVSLGRRGPVVPRRPPPDRWPRSSGAETARACCSNSASVACGPQRHRPQTSPRKRRSPPACCGRCCRSSPGWRLSWPVRSCVLRSVWPRDTAIV